MVVNWDFLQPFVWLYPLFYFGVCLFIVKSTGFHIPVNDFWMSFLNARFLDIKKPVSFYNGFFPLGYAVFLRIFSFGRSLYAPFIYNLAFGAASLYGVAYLGSTVLEPHWVLLLIVVLSLAPKFFRYTCTPGADTGMSAFTVIGAAVLLEGAVSGQSATGFVFILGGALLGFASLWRYHGLVLAAGFITGAALFSGNPVLTLAASSAGFIAIYSVQIIFNLLSGRRPFETSQSFQVYIMMYGVDWLETSSMKVPGSIMEVVFSSPGRFIKTFMRSFLEVSPLLLPSLLCIIFFDDDFSVRMSASIGVAMLIYLLVAAMGRSFSDRAEIPVLPFVAFQIILFFRFILERLDGAATGNDALVLAAAIMAAAVFIFAIRSFKTNIHIVRQWKRVHGIFVAVESILKKEGVKSSDQVFTTGIDLYFPGLYPHYIFNRTGGYGRDSTYMFEAKYPEIKAGMVKELIDQCESRGITHIILASDCRTVSEEFGDLYEGNLISDRLEKAGAVFPFKLYRIEKP